VSEQTPSRKRQGAGLVGIGGDIRGGLTLEERLRVSALDLYKSSRRLVEIEDVVDTVGASVGRAEAPQVPDVLDESHDAAELVLRVRDVAWFGVGRDDDRRNAES